VKGRNVYILLIIQLLVFVIVGCEKTKPVVLKELGPSKTKAGVAFNAQPDGGAAMWFKTENATQTLVVMWNDKQIRADFKRPDFLTAAIPKDLYSKPGQYQVYLQDTKTGAKSNSLTFTVE
jgi:hypothetical protein